MTRKEALEFVKTSGYDHFRYGDLSYMTEKKEALQDIESMEELAWNDGDIYGAILIVPVSKEEYLEWYNRVVKDKYKTDDYTEDEVYDEYVQDCEAETTHELPGMITKYGNPIIY